MSDQLHGMLSGFGQVAVFDQNGKQVPELQKGGFWVLWAKHAEGLGYDPTGVVFDCIATGLKVRITKSEAGGYGWEIIK